MLTAVFPWWSGPDCHDDSVTTAATPKGERRRQALVESAAELILEGGIDAVRHRAVANRAGLPLASTTYYFESLDELVVVCPEGDSAEWVSRHRVFHEYLCSLAERPRLLRQINALYSVIEPHMRLWLQHVDKPMSAREEHAVILDALRSGDAREAERVLCEHIEGTVPSLLKFLEAKGA